MGLLSNIMGPQGLIGHYGLTDWWLTVFTPQESDALESEYAQSRGTAAGGGLIGLTRGMVQGFTPKQSPARFVAGLAPLVDEVAHDKEPAVWAKAEELALASGSLLELHAVYSGSVTAFYARRDEDEQFMQAALGAAEELVRMAPEVAEEYRRQRPGRDLPPHRGFKLLAVLAEKRGDDDEALSLCRQAQEQGWAGDWDVRVARLEEKQRSEGG